MEYFAILTNKILLAALAGWFAAQSIKVIYDYRITQQWSFSILLEPGGMPSSHSAFVAALTHATGLFIGFGSTEFAISFVLASIVIYDATGIRREAGKQAHIINTIIEEFKSGHPLKGTKLREMLGHTPMEALAGTLLGILVAQVIWLLTR
jgi:acid phosphatase family membrane protein YuiD